MKGQYHVGIKRVQEKRTTIGGPVSFRNMMEHGLTDLVYLDDAVQTRRIATWRLTYSTTLSRYFGMPCSDEQRECFGTTL